MLKIIRNNRYSILHTIKTPRRKIYNFLKKEQNELNSPKQEE